MSQASKGNTVKVHYTGKLKDDTIFDSTDGREPIEFTLGAGQMIPGFENAVLGMELGESKTVTIPSVEAYGERREDMLVNVPRTDLPDDFDPEMGQRLRIKQDNGYTLNVVVTDIDDSSITLDANHPLAGKDLIFSIELVEIN